MAGLSPRTAKVVKRYADLATVVGDAARSFAGDVANRVFRGEEHSCR